ncbi:MAG: hypothetical protein ACXVCP_04170 [Bdellovibrio sp.]
MRTKGKSLVPLAKLLGPGAWSLEGARLPGSVAARLWRVRAIVAPAKAAF